MPRPTGDPDAILAALPPRIRAGFLEALELLELGERWEEAPAVAGFAELVAFVAETRRLELDEGLSEERARIAAGMRLDMNDEAVARRLRRQRSRATDKTSSVPPRRAG